MFFPLQNTCMTSTPTLSRPSPDSLYGLRNEQQIAPNGTNVGSIYAISVETGKTLWKYEQRAGMMSLLSTAGGLVFGGDTNGRFRAFDQRDGPDLVGSESRLADLGLPGQLRRRRQAVRRRQHGLLVDGDGRQPPDARADPKPRQQSVRLRACRTRPVRQ